MRLRNIARKAVVAGILRAGSIAQVKTALFLFIGLVSGLNCYLKKILQKRIASLILFKKNRHSTDRLNPLILYFQLLIIILKLEKSIANLPDEVAVFASPLHPSGREASFIYI